MTSSFSTRDIQSLTSLTVRRKSLMDNSLRQRRALSLTVSNSRAWKGKANTKGIDVLPLHAVSFRVQWQQENIFSEEFCHVCQQQHDIQLKASTLKASEREAFQIFAVILPTDDVCLYFVFHSAWEGESALVSFDFPVHVHYCSAVAALPTCLILSESHKRILFH